jgi:hypothetical protein
MAELRSAIFWVLNCPIYLLRCYRSDRFKIQEAKNCENVAFLLLSLSAKRCKSPELGLAAWSAANPNSGLLMCSESK